MDIAVSFKDGALITNLKPLFSENAESVFVASKDTVLQYNVHTGKLVYQYTGCEVDIIGFSVNTVRNVEYLAACGRNGHVIVWQLSDKTKLLQERFPFMKLHFFSIVNWNFNNNSLSLKVLISFTTKHGKMAFAAIDTKNFEGKPAILLKVPEKVSAVDVCQDKYFAVAFNNELHIVNIKNEYKRRIDIAAANRKFTCVACHPSEELVLTGDDTGRVILWHNIFGKKYVQSLYHWHSMPVRCLSFSAMGSFFYSGSDESVLVKWHIDNDKQKQFLPRLPAGLVQISVAHNNALVAIATDDNAIRLIDAQMHEVSLIQKLVIGKHFDSGIIYDPITRALVMNGNVGCVQFYSPYDSSLLYNVEIVNQNRITDERNCKLQNTEVKKMALSRDGRWLVTFEQRQEGTKYHELKLKFWLFNTEKRTYQLNTFIDFPHEQTIHNIAMQPVFSDEGLVCITVGADKLLKIWQLSELKSVYRSGPVWNCVHTSSFRNLPCKGLSFSSDGSLFATAFDVILTIWDANNYELKSTLVHSDYKNKILFVQFGQAALQRLALDCPVHFLDSSQCHLIVTASKTLISVWNILSLTLNWVTEVSEVTLLVADPLSTYMAVVCDSGRHGKRSKVFIFEPLSSDRVYAGTILKKIAAATFAPSIYSNDTRLKWHERVNLYFITSNNELFSLSKREELYENDMGLAEDLSESKSVFAKIKPKISKSEAKTPIVNEHLFAESRKEMNYRKYLETPITTLPPISKLAYALLSSLVLKKEGTRTS